MCLDQCAISFMTFSKKCFSITQMIPYITDRLLPVEQLATTENNALYSKYFT